MNSEREFAMTNRDLVKRAIAHKEADRIPYAINFTQKAYDAYGMRVLEEYGNSKVRDAYESGNLSLSEAVSLAIGNHVFSIGAPWWDWYQVPEEYAMPDEPEELPHTRGTGSYEGFYQKVAYLRENFDVYILTVIYGSHFEKANMARGIENFLADLCAAPEFSKRILDFIIEKNMVMLDNIASTPEVDGILLGSDWGTQTSLLMSPQTWRQFIEPGERREFELIRAHGKDCWLHSCGNIETILPDIIDLGIQTVNPVQPECMDVRHLKENYGDALTFWGGLSTQRTLPYGTPQDVKNEAEDLISFMPRNGGYILAPSQEIQVDVTYENLKALIDVARSYGMGENEKQ